MKTKSIALLFVCTVGLMLATGCVTATAIHVADHQAYSQYVEQTNQLNAQRAKDGLPPEPVLTFHQWRWKGSN